MILQTQTSEADGDDEARGRPPACRATASDAAITKSALVSLAQLLGRLAAQEALENATTDGPASPPDDGSLKILATP